MHIFRWHRVVCAWDKVRYRVRKSDWWLVKQGPHLSTDKKIRYYDPRFKRVVSLEAVSLDVLVILVNRLKERDQIVEVIKNGHIVKDGEEDGTVIPRGITATGIVVEDGVVWLLRHHGRYTVRFRRFRSVAEILAE